MVLGHHFSPQHVQTRKKPATTRRLLIGNSFGRNPMRKITVDLGTYIGVRGQFLNVGSGQSITQSLVFGRILVTIAQLTEHFRIDAAFVLSPPRRRTECQKRGKKNFRYSHIHVRLGLFFVLDKDTKSNATAPHFR